MKKLCCLDTGESMNRSMFDRLTNRFVQVKDAWVTFAACDQQSTKRYIARDVKRVYMSQRHQVVLLTDRRDTWRAGRELLEALTPAAVT